MEIIQTSDGSHTIYIPEINEQYHSVNGAITESEYVYIEKGFNFHQVELPKVFEVGFGTGLNCLLTAIAAEKQKKPTLYCSIEKFPLSSEITSQLNFGKITGTPQLFEKIHSCSWNSEIRLSPYFSLLKIAGDLTDFNFSKTEKYNIIYFDAFGPDKQPEMWTPAIFSKIAALTLTEGVFVTYSAKGDVRRDLGIAGFSMERLPGPPGKKQMLRGIKKIPSI